MVKTLQPHSMRLVIDWFELEDDAYPDVGLPLGISVFVELQVEPNSVFTVMKGVDGVINLESTWYKGVTKIADKAPKASVEDAECQSSNTENEEVAHFDTQGDLYSADNLDEGESITSSSPRSSDTVRPSTSTIRPKPSKIPIRKSGTDGTFDDLDLELDIPASPTLSSRDSLPWHSTKDTADDISDGNGQTEIDLDDLFTDLEDIYQPILRYENGDIILQAAREVEPGFYKVEIAFYRHFERDTQGWYGIDLCDVVKTCPPIPGKLVFNLQTYPSLITDIVGPEDLHDMEDGSREASLDPREEPYLAFWVWTHATYLEFWGEREVDKTYYDDLIAPNTYLDSDELVDYVEFMFKTRDDEDDEDGGDDVATEMMVTPEKEAQSNLCMSAIAEEEEEKEEQVDELIPGNAMTLNVDHVVSCPEEGPIFEEEECQRTEDENVVWEDVPIPNVDTVERGPEQGSVLSSDEDSVRDMVPEIVTSLNTENVVSESEEISITPFFEEAMSLKPKDTIETNVMNVTSTSEEAAGMFAIAEEVDSVVLESVAAPNVKNTTSESEASSKTPTIEKEHEILVPEDIITSNIDNAIPPNNNSPNDEIKSSGPYQSPPSPPLPSYAGALECCNKCQEAAFRRRALYRLLSTFFVLVFAVCACMSCPPGTISMPKDTLYKVKYYANHLGDMGYKALMNVNAPFADFWAPQGEWPDGSAASPGSGKKGENGVEEYFLWDLIDETLEIPENSDPIAVSKSVETTVESAASASESELDAEESPPPSVAGNPEIASILDTITSRTAPAQTETTAISLPVKANPLPPEPALTILASLAKDLLHHIACSTSPICTISRISDKYEQPWDIFARFQCDGKGGWEPETRRDGFDRFWGWVPDECKVHS